jgi:hypothetical protein
LERRGKRLAPVDRRIAEPFEDGMNLIPNDLPFGALAGQVEIGQHAFEPVDQLRTALKPWISTTFIEKGFDLLHRYQRSSRCRTMAGLSGFFTLIQSRDGLDR